VPAIRSIPSLAPAMERTRSSSLASSAAVPLEMMAVIEHVSPIGDLQAPGQ
jgi:hypothetical protein